ncbi:piggyBac transposable element-derived protein 4-like [Acyrthosiphon pisum]|uniref:PiggyBac transposable element-derived protein domain-containing protein n=1 Tax=Acyrthosiphon pisum TaxID=7029 RepID=A0A8R2B4A6_ACYPI|nr:piggyBac transposable element-derived protein 4-like [Acyrthosiphon pisum]|eukprot:XP_008181107.1 PREDICTED: piggyBac transposable element-derived protein 4-like [Acyrthosiphon pisum]
MPVNRFSWLLSHLHLNDNSVIPKKGDANYDKLYKVRPFLNLILKNSQVVYNPNRVVAIDESMIKFKGRHSSKQYMPKKPIKRGYKVWALADNYPLMSYLKSNGIYACGTVNMTRKHLPQLKDDKSLKQGEYDWNTDQFSISIIKWKDKRSVSLLSNFHNPTDTDIVPRREKDGTLTMIPCPKVLKDYNENMNCVDKLDQNKKSCQIDRKSQKWWHRIFFHFIDIAVVNSHVIYTQSTGTTITMKNFRRDISRELLNKTIVCKCQSKSTKKSPAKIKKHKPFVPDSLRLEKSAHQPKISTRRRCAKCSTREKEVRTEWMCIVCNVPLCITKNRNCFADHHK